MADSKGKSSSPRKAKASPPPALPTAPVVSGFRVQVIYRAPKVSANLAPKDDNLWFSVYPIIPRVGDNICHGGIYYRVEQVFLYESTTPSWCADLVVSYVGHQQRRSR